MLIPPGKRTSLHVMAGRRQTEKQVLAPLKSRNKTWRILDMRPGNPVRKPVWKHDRNKNTQGRSSFQVVLRNNQCDFWRILAAKFLSCFLMGFPSYRSRNLLFFIVHIKSIFSQLNTSKQLHILLSCWHNTYILVKIIFYMFYSVDLV